MSCRTIFLPLIIKNAWVCCSLILIYIKILCSLHDGPVLRHICSSSIVGRSTLSTSFGNTPNRNPWIKNLMICQLYYKQYCCSLMLIDSVWFKKLIWYRYHHTVVWNSKIYDKRTKAVLDMILIKNLKNQLGKLLFDMWPFNFNQSL